MPMSKQISAINVLSDVCPRGGPFQTQILIRLVISIRIPFTLLRSITGIINTAPAFGNRKDHINLASLLLTGWASTGAGHGVNSAGPERGLQGNGASAWKELILGKQTWHMHGLLGDNPAVARLERWAPSPCVMVPLASMGVYIG